MIYKYKVGDFVYVVDIENGIYYGIISEVDIFNCGVAYAVIPIEKEDRISETPVFCAEQHVFASEVQAKYCLKERLKTKMIQMTNKPIIKKF